MLSSHLTPVISGPVWTLSAALRIAIAEASDLGPGSRVLPVLRFVANPVGQGFSPDPYYPSLPEASFDHGIKLAGPAHYGWAAGHFSTILLTTATIRREFATALLYPSSSRLVPDHAPRQSGALPSRLAASLTMPVPRCGGGDPIPVRPALKAGTHSWEHRVLALRAADLGKTDLPKQSNETRPKCVPPEALAFRFQVRVPGARHDEDFSSAAVIPEPLDTLIPLAAGQAQQGEGPRVLAVAAIANPTRLPVLEDATSSLNAPVLTAWDGPATLTPPLPLRNIRELRPVDPITPSSKGIHYPVMRGSEIPRMPAGLRSMVAPEPHALLPVQLKKSSSAADGRIMEAALPGEPQFCAGFPISSGLRIPFGAWGGLLTSSELGIAIRYWAADLRGAVAGVAFRSNGPQAKGRSGLNPLAWSDDPDVLDRGGRPGRWKQLLAVPRIPAVAKKSVLVLMMLLPIGWLVTSSRSQATEEPAPRPGAFAAIQARFAERAGIELADDFRTGLHDWQGAGDWADSWTFDQAGFVRPGQLALYSPSLGMRDYRLEFVGQIEKKSLAWVVRAADLKNYVVVKLVQLKGGPLPQMAIERYAVVNGKEEKGSRTTIPVEARTDTIYRIAMEVDGERYSVFVQGRLVDTWEDGRLLKGGVGFFSGKGEAGRLRSVQVTYQNDWVGRICAVLAG